MCPNWSRIGMGRLSQAAAASSQLQGQEQACCRCRVSQRGTRQRAPEHNLFLSWSTSANTLLHTTLCFSHKREMQMIPLICDRLLSARSIFSLLNKLLLIVTVSLSSHALCNLSLHFLLCVVYLLSLDGFNVCKQDVSVPSTREGNLLRHFTHLCGACS